MSSSDSSPDLATIVARDGGRHRLRRVAGYGLLVAAAAAGFFYYQKRKDAEDTGPTYVTETVKRGDLALTVTATGNLQPTNQVSVGSELSGIVQEVNVDRNDKVKKGQPLAKIDTTKLMQTNASLKANRLAAISRVGQAEATLKESDAALGRLQELHRLSGGKTPAPWSKGDPDRVEVNLSLQLAQIIEGNEVKRVISASSGMPGFDTPPGRFNVYLKDPNGIIVELAELPALADGHGSTRDQECQPQASGRTDRARGGARDRRRHVRDAPSGAARRSR